MRWYRSANVVVCACGIALGSLSACSADQAAEPVELGEIVVADGSQQDGLAGEALARDIEITVRDRSGAPVPGVRVEWMVDDDGVVDPAVSVSDAQGRARTRWKLGPNEGTRMLTALANGYRSSTVRANALFAYDALHTLSVDTYDGSGQTVHPDFVTVPRESAMRGEYMAITAYPSGNAAYENPAVFQSTDRLRWSVPIPSINPLVTPTSGYLSDPDLVYEPVQRELWMYYRQVADENEIYLMRSSDAHTWTAPERVVHRPNHSIVSPSVVRRSESEWLMWSIDGKEGCTAAKTAVQLRRSIDGIHWSDAEPVALDQPGFAPWHIEVQWIPSRDEYWAVYNVKTTESCSTPALFLATSKDGVTWTTYPSPVIYRGDSPDLKDIVYRSTFAVDAIAGSVTFWYSGATHDGRNFVWRSVAQRKRIVDLMARISETFNRRTALRAGVPLLMDPP